MTQNSAASLKIMTDPARLRRGLLFWGLTVELGLIPLALVIAWLFPTAERDVLRVALQRVDVVAVWAGLAGVVPLALLFVISWRSNFGPSVRMRRLLEGLLLEPLRACRWYDLVLLCAAAGVGEELLFRGVLQPRIGVTASSVLFGFAHALTPTYALMAGFVSGYLGWLALATDSLWTPILTHGAYDLLACLWLRHYGGTRDDLGPEEEKAVGERS